MAAVALLLAGTYGQFMLHREAPVADSKRYDVALAFTAPAGETRTKVQAADGQSFSVDSKTYRPLSEEPASGPAPEPKIKVTASFALTAAGPETVRLDGGFGCGGGNVAHPALTARLGEPTPIDPATAPGAPPCNLTVVVTQLPSVQ